MVSPMSELTTMTPTRTLSDPMSVWVIKCSTNFFCSKNSASEMLSDPSNRNIISPCSVYPIIRAEKDDKKKFDYQKLIELSV